jgi:hypothetical protein
VSDGNTAAAPGRAAASPMTSPLSIRRHNRRAVLQAGTPPDQARFATPIDGRLYSSPMTGQAKRLGAPAPSITTNRSERFNCSEQPGSPAPHEMKAGLAHGNRVGRRTRQLSGCKSGKLINHHCACQRTIHRNPTSTSPPQRPQTVRLLHCAAWR